MPVVAAGGLGRLRESVRVKMPGFYSLGLLAGNPLGHLTSSGEKTGRLQPINAPWRPEGPKVFRAKIESDPQKEI
jgi:hypothetical protein